MKKNIKAFVISCTLVLSSLTMHAQTQSSDQPTFISKILPAIPVVMTETESVRVSYIDGIVDGAQAFSLVFENKTDNEITFIWTLKDKNGNEIGASRMKLAPHAKIDYTSPADMAEFLTYMTDDITHPEDCTVTLSF